MNFLEIISKIISLIINFFIFSVVLIIFKKYYFDFLNIFISCVNSLNVFLVIRSSDYDIGLNNKILIKNKIFIGNEANNNIVLKSNCSDIVKLGIYVQGEDIYAENFNNTENIKINNKNVLGKIKLEGNEEILVFDVLFQLVREVKVKY